MKTKILLLFILIVALAIAPLFAVTVKTYTLTDLPNGVKMPSGWFFKTKSDRVHYEFTTKIILQKDYYYQDMFVSVAMPYGQIYGEFPTPFGQFPAVRAACTFPLFSTITKKRRLRVSGTSLR